MSKKCVLPYIHSLILPNGDINVCCNAEVSQDMPSVKDGYDNILNNPRHIKIRELFEQDIEPTECNRCWTNESLGIKSYRQQQNFTYMMHYPKVWLKRENDVKFFDVRFNNTCNLKCVMCSSGYSTAWIEDERKLSIIKDITIKTDMTNRVNQYDKDSFKWSTDENIVESILQNAKNLERLHFAGGEPLLSKHHKILIKELIKQGHAPNLFLSYNTNGEYIDDELLSLWSMFKRVKVFYSLDGIGEQNEYIRYPSVWKEHEERLDYIDKVTTSNMSWRLLTTVSALNIGSIPELADWKLSKNYKNIHNNLLDGNLFHACPLEHPSYLSSTVLPLDIKEQITQKVLSFSASRSYKKIANECVSYMNSMDNSFMFPTLENYLSELDKIRNTDYKTTFPILLN